MGEGDALLERMRASKSGWKPRDFERLYGAFGFEFREGSRHRLYFHPKYKDLFAAVPRHQKLKSVYATKAVKLIDELKSREAENEK